MKMLIMTYKYSHYLKKIMKAMNKWKKNILGKLK